METNKPGNSNENKKPAPISDELAEALSEHHKALASEFEIANKELTAHSEASDLKAYWRNKVPDACAQIAWLAMHAYSEGVRLNANKFIIAEAYAQTQDSELEEILKQLTTVA